MNKEQGYEQRCYRSQGFINFRSWGVSCWSFDVYEIAECILILSYKFLGEMENGMYRKVNQASNELEKEGREQWDTKLEIERLTEERGK